MVDITFDQLVQVVRELPEEQKLLLVERMNLPELDMGPTRESLIAELETLRAAGTFDHVESLRNRFANSTSADLTDEQLAADIHAAATEWEKELDEFFNDSP